MPIFSSRRNVSNLKNNIRHQQKQCSVNLNLIMTKIWCLTTILYNFDKYLSICLSLEQQKNFIFTPLQNGPVLYFTFNAVFLAKRSFLEYDFSVIGSFYPQNVDICKHLLHKIKSKIFFFIDVLIFKIKILNTIKKM